MEGLLAPIMNFNNSIPSSKRPIMEEERHASHKGIKTGRSNYYILPGLVA